MTEVSNVLQFGQSEPRPLDVVKDGSSYIEASYTQPHDSFRRISSFHFTDINSTNSSSQKQIRRLHDVGNKFKQSSFIDMVAVANGSYEDTSSKKSDSDALSIDKTIVDTTIAPKFWSSKERTISIPGTQTFTELPNKFSHKKPVFYKHSGTEVNHEYSLTNMYKIRSKTCSDFKESKVVPNSNAAVLIQKYGQTEDTEGENTKLELYDCPAKVMDAKTVSPQRRCALMQKLEQRKMTSIPTCEAVDIMDTTQTIQIQIKYEEETKTKEKPSSTIEFPSLALYRSKTFPAFVFAEKSRLDCATPGKTKRESSNSSLQPSNRQKIFSDALITSMPDAIVGKPVKSFSALGRSRTFSYFSRETMSSDSISLRNMSKESRLASLALKFQTPSNGKAIDTLEKLYLSKRSDPSKNVEKQNRPRENFPVLSSDRAKRKTQNMNHIGRDMVRKIDELQNRISRHLSRNNVSEKPSEDTSKTFRDTNTMSFNEYVRQQRLRLRHRNVTLFRDRQKHVTFADQSAKRFASEESMEANGLRNTDTIAKCNECQSSKSLSAKELLRLKRKLIPGEFSKPLQKKFELSRDITLSGMRSAEIHSEAARPVSDMPGATDRACTNVPKSQGSSSFYPDHEPDQCVQSEEEEVDTCNSSLEAGDTADINDAEKKNRVINAVDMGSYSEFQHRRFKKPFNCNDNHKTRFLKIKLEN